MGTESKRMEKYCWLSFSRLAQCSAFLSFCVYLPFRNFIISLGRFSGNVWERGSKWTSKQASESKREGEKALFCAINSGDNSNHPRVTWHFQYGKFVACLFFAAKILISLVNRVKNVKFTEPTLEMVLANPKVIFFFVRRNSYLNIVPSIAMDCWGTRNRERLEFEKTKGERAESWCWAVKERRKPFKKIGY